MKIFPVDIYKFIMWWHFYSNMCAVDSSDYIRKTDLTENCAYSVGMFTCIVWEFDIPVWDADNSIRLGWHGSAQGRLAYVLRSNACRSSAHSSRQIALGNLKWLMSQLPSCASKSSLSLNTHSLRIAPFAKSSNITKAAIVFNSMHCTTLRMLLYQLV